MNKETKSKLNIIITNLKCINYFECGDNQLLQSAINILEYLTQDNQN